MGQHGIFDFFSFYGKRNITFEGIIIAEDHDQLIQIEQRLQRIFSLPSQPIEDTNDGYINIKWTDTFGTEYNIDAKIQQDLQFRRSVGNQTEASFFISLKSDNPLIFSVEEHEETGLMGWRQGQFIVPAFIPNNINIAYRNLINIYQNGTSDSPGKFRLHGPVTNPKVTRLQEVFTNEEQISNFVTGWVGGTDDIDNYQLGGKSQKLTSINGVQATMNLNQAIDIDFTKFITLYFYIDDIDNIEPGDYLTGENYIKFIETSGVREFVAELDLGNETLRNGWNYFILLKDQFKKIGTPSWNDITDVEISIKSTAGTTLNISFDDLKSRNIAFTEKYLELALTIASGDYIEFDTLNGTIKRNGTVDVSSNLSLDSNWFYLLPRQNLLLYESDTNPNITFEYPTQQFDVLWRDAIL